MFVNFLNLVNFYLIHQYILYKFDYNGYLKFDFKRIMFINIHNKIPHNLFVYYINNFAIL